MDDLFQVLIGSYTVDKNCVSDYSNTIKTVVFEGWMFRFNKDMEYALIALVEMTRLPAGQLISAREISVKFEIPFKLLARILQKLRAGNLIRAMQGPQGGYCLKDIPQDIRLGRIIKAVRGDERIADCLTDDGNCAQENCGCTIKPFIQVFQDKWIAFVENISLDEFTRSKLTEYSEKR